AYRLEVQLQTADRPAQGIAVHAQSFGSSTLIPFAVSQHRQDERALELPQRFLESHPASVHLRHEYLELRPHDGLSPLHFSKIHASLRIPGIRKLLWRTKEHPNGKGRDIGY